MAHTVITIRPSFWFFMGVILSDFHEHFQTATGRETEDGISDAATRRQVCPRYRGRGEKSGQRNSGALTA
jgi:hypothetical protein